MPSRCLFQKYQHDSDSVLMKLLVCTFLSVWRESTQNLNPEGGDERSLLSPSFASLNFRTFGPLWSETLAFHLTVVHTDFCYSVDCSILLVIISVVAKCTNWPSPWVCPHRNIVTRMLSTGWRVRLPLVLPDWISEDQGDRCISTCI